MTLNTTKYNNLILIGMPAVGKSTLGVVLAKRIGFGFTDTDLDIQSGEGVGLRDIIHDRGIEKFCDLEATYVRQLKPRKTVIATGGSVVYRDSTMAHLNKLGCIIFLDIQFKELAKRLKAIDARGVVHTPGQTINQLYVERRPLYQRYADIIVDCTHRSLEETLQRVLSGIIASKSDIDISIR